MSRDHGLVARLLILALLHCCVGGVWAGNVRHRWPERLAASLDAAQALVPGRTMPFKAWRLDGGVLQGELVGLEMEPDSLYQPRLARWLAADPARAVLPALGHELWLESKFKRGRAVCGTFLGFDGPHLLLGRVDGVEGPLTRVAVTRMRLATTAGRLLLEAKELDQGGDWPPSRASLLAFFPLGMQRIPLDSLQDLSVRQRTGGGGSAFVVGFFMAIVALPFLYGLPWFYGHGFF
jgi:hypothetical protein